MNILVAKNIGFCFGVDRAYDLSMDTLENCEESCHMLGHLVHNEDVVNKLEEKGLNFLFSTDEAKEGTVIIRAHGVGNSTIKELEKKNLNIVDATCPLVRKAQDKARALREENRQVVIIGKKDHPEVMALNGGIDEDGIVIEKEEEIDSLKGLKKVGIVMQTTQNPEAVYKIIKAIEKIVDDVEVRDTFCNTVTNRQKEAKELSQKTDLVLVIGSKNSSNTQSLVKVINEAGGNVQGIENQDDINKDWFKDGMNVGVISGTSAPRWIIEDVIKYLEEIKKEL